MKLNRPCTKIWMEGWREVIQREYYECTPWCPVPGPGSYMKKWGRSIWVLPERAPVELNRSGQFPSASLPLLDISSCGRILLVLSSLSKHLFLGRTAFFCRYQIVTSRKEGFDVGTGPDRSCRNWHAPTCRLCIVTRNENGTDIFRPYSKPNPFRWVEICSYLSPDIQHLISYPYLNTQIAYL